MKRYIKSLVALGAFATLAAASNAAITFTNPSNAQFGQVGSGVAKWVPTLDIATPSSGSYMGSILAHSTTGFIDVTATVGANGAYSDSPGTASIGYFVTVTNLATNAVTTIYSAPTVLSDDTAPGLSAISPQGQKSLVGMDFRVDYSFTYNLTDVDDEIAFSDATFTFHDSQSTPPPPVPEPASFAALAIGGLGLISRRRKGAK